MARRSKAAAAAAPSNPVSPLVLPAELTIYTVAELQPQWREWLGQLAATPPAGATAPVHAAAVDQVDAAGLQMLMALRRSIAARAWQCRLQDASGALRAACSGLGLERCLDEGVAA